MPLQVLMALLGRAITALSEHRLASLQSPGARALQGDDRRWLEPRTAPLDERIRRKGGHVMSWIR
jgi:hypothetical protein